MTKWRDAAIWLVALGLIIYEAVIYKGEPRFALLTLYAGMLGLPIFFRADDRRAHGTETPPEPPQPRETQP